MSIVYPGKKVEHRRPPDGNGWVNLYDFLVQPYSNGTPLSGAGFTFERMLKDFAENKTVSEEFWQILYGVYSRNVLIRNPPSLSGIDSRLFLLVLKWLWILEDLNYRYDWEESRSPIAYEKHTKRDRLIKSGAGRAKLFAALFLVKTGMFTLEQVLKIIPLARNKR